ncbi:MAG: tRNA lysidine(34) synthetase TilS [Clostridia bacterium]|nr:tRNA lysidine(34) synthetase TilS [Clostridia bacterium]
MLGKVRSAINDFCLLNGVKTVAVALSGGADSVALLNSLLSLKDEYGIEVFAAHYNHRLRGAESDADESFVKALCDKLGVKLFTGDGDVAAFAKQNKLGIELAARQMRYAFFEGLAADAVATAHTASDNLETVIFNLTRGSALDGLCGIPPKRDRYIRPLILCTREEIEKYCSDNGLTYVTDSSNLTDDYARNRIRHKVIPVLKEINPAAESNAVNTALSLMIDRDKLNDIARQKYLGMLTPKGLDVKTLTDEGPAVSSRVLRLFCKEKTGISPDFKHTDDLFAVAVGGGRCSLEGGAVAYRQKGILKIDTGEDTAFNVKIVKEDLSFIKKSKKINNLLLNNLIDCDKIAGEIIVRTRREGDKIRLAGRGCTKTLKQLYNEKAIPQNERANLPVVSDDEGVIWVAGFGAAQRVAASENSKAVYKIVYETVYGGNNKS